MSPGRAASGQLGGTRTPARPASRVRVSPGWAVVWTLAAVVPLVFLAIFFAWPAILVAPST